MNRTSKAGLYIHIPFCHSKCGYCDFYSVTNSELMPDFIHALKKEIEYYARQSEFQTEYDSIYLGGGTPSLLGLTDIEQILSSVIKYFTISADVEITLEANPGTLNLEKLRGIRSAGINRLSLGVQSFIDLELKFLGRIHNVQEAEHTLVQALETGFSEMSIDLIFALPGQSTADWEFSLKRALSFQPHHISAYNLIIEEGTPFYSFRQNGLWKSAEADHEADFFILTEDILRESGYLHYEVSNYAKSDMNISRHNYKYWQHTPCLSFGPSAHSFWPNRRWQNVRSVSDYIQIIQRGQRPVTFQEQLTDKQILYEHVFLALRTYQGINLSEFENAFNLDFLNIYQRPVQNLLENALAVLDNEYFKLTSKGMLLCDEILPQFI